MALSSEHWKFFLLQPWLFSPSTIKHMALSSEHWKLAAVLARSALLVGKVCTNVFGRDGASL